jgi:DNA transposition AAA+ family ATPase
MNREPGPAFVETLEYRRFAEFCEACARYRYIGLCYGPPGVGKTLSARQQAAWDEFEQAPSPHHVSDDQLPRLAGQRALFYTTPVVNAPRQVETDILLLHQQLRRLAEEPLRREEAARFQVFNAEAERQQQEFLVNVDWLSEQARKPWKPPYADLAHEYHAKRNALGDPLHLLLVDEADRLSMDSLEQLRDLFDRGRFGLVLIGMPGLERRLARYAQLYSRVGFVHEFRPLSAAEVQRLLQEHWTPTGTALLKEATFDDEVVATIIRVTGGNFRLLHRLLAQVERILGINQLDQITKAVVEAARESLVIGQV